MAITAASSSPAPERRPHRGGRTRQPAATLAAAPGAQEPVAQQQTRQRAMEPTPLKQRAVRRPAQSGVNATLLRRLVDATPVAMLVFETGTLRVRFANGPARRIMADLAALDALDALDALEAAEDAPSEEELIGARLDTYWPVEGRRELRARAELMAQSGEPMLGLTLRRSARRDGGLDERTREYASKERGDGQMRIWKEQVWSYDMTSLGAPGQPTDLALLTLSDRTEEWRERQRTEAATFNAQLYAERLEGVLEQIGEAVILRDQNGQLIAYNRAALAFARNRAEVERGRARGRRVEPEWLTLQPDGETLSEREQPMWRAILTGAPAAGVELMMRRENDVDAPVLCHAAPLRDEAGDISGVIIAFQDITSTKAAERSRDEFLSVASHELRQPLTVIQGQAQMLKRHLRRLEAHEGSGAGGAPQRLSSEALRQLADGVESQTARLNLLVSDLLDLSRIQVGQLTLDQSRTPLLPLLRHLVELQHAISLEHRFTLHELLDHQTPEPVGWWDARRIEQILLNLFSNAIKYSPNGGEVRVELRTALRGMAARRLAAGVAGQAGGPPIKTRRVEGPAAHIAIIDQGIGIPADALSRLFERFYRAQNTSGIQGAGLGLYICHQLAWSHGGDLWAESRGIGQGSAFHLVLPLLRD